jgi:hypothetical protein
MEFNTEGAFVSNDVAYGRDSNKNYVPTKDTTRCEGFVPQRDPGGHPPTATAIILATQIRRLMRRQITAGMQY